MAQEQNIQEGYNYNVKSISDLKENNLRLLSKEGKNCRFEYGGDYWNYENGVLIQYKSYDDLFGKEQSGKIVFAPKEGLVSDYGAVLTDQIWNSDKLNKLTNFSLKDKHDYIYSESKENSKKIIPLDIEIDKNLSEKLEKTNRSNKEKINNTPLLDVKELEPVKAIAQAFLDTLTVAFSFSKSLKVRKSKPENYIDDILLKMEQNEINPNKLSHRAILEKDPKIKELLDKYEHFSVQLKQQNMPNEKIVENVVKRALEDDTFMNSAESLANSEMIEKQFAKQTARIKDFFNKTKGYMDNIADSKEAKNTIYSLNLEQKQNFIKKIRNIDLFKVFKTQDLDPKNFNDRMEVFLANAFLISMANEEELNYKHIMTKHVGIADDDLYKNLSFAKVSNIATEISKDILKSLDIKAQKTEKLTQENKIKIRTN